MTNTNSNTTCEYRNPITRRRCTRIATHTSSFRRENPAFVELRCCGVHARAVDHRALELGEPRTMVRLALAAVVALAIGACAVGDNELAPATPDPTTCEGLEAITVAAPDVGEVLLDGYARTRGISYHCDDVTTWSYYARRRLDDGRLGSYGRLRVGLSECAWFDALDSRTPATGTCP